MKTHFHLTGNAKTLDAFSRFLGALETLTPEPVSPPKAICGEDDVTDVEVGYRTDEDTFLAGDHMVHVGAQMVEETDILVALAPFVVESPRQKEGNEAG
jgi:hypothetical protein